MIIQSRARAAATELKIAAEVAHVLEREPHLHGQVLERFYRTGTADSEELIEAACFEQGYASAEGHAALYCLIGWVRAKARRLSA